MVSGHSSNGSYTRDPSRVFQVKELPAFFQEALPSGISQIHGRIPLPLLLLAPRRRIFRYPHGFRFGSVKVFLDDHVQDLSSKLHSVGTSLMRNFDLYFPERRTFFFSDVCLTQCSPCESYSSNWFQHSCALPRNRCRSWRLSVL